MNQGILEYTYYQIQEQYREKEADEASIRARTGTVLSLFIAAYSVLFSSVFSVFTFLSTNPLALLCFMFVQCLSIGLFVAGVSYLINGLVPDQFHDYRNLDELTKSFNKPREEFLRQRISDYHETYKELKGLIEERAQKLKRGVRCCLSGFGLFLLAYVFIGFSLVAGMGLCL